MIKFTLLFVIVTVVYIQCVPTQIFNDFHISNVTSIPVHKQLDVQYKEQDQLTNQSVYSTLSPNEISNYYKWLAFLKLSTSTTSNDFTNQPKTK